jgi:hypothetical protein
LGGSGLGLVPGIGCRVAAGVWVRWKAGGVANLKEEWCPALESGMIQARGLWGCGTVELEERRSSRELMS